MTDHRARTPGRVRGPILAPIRASDGALTLGRTNRSIEAPFEPLGAGMDDAQAAPVHPDFLARAAIWRDQAAGLLSLAEARLRSAAIGRADRAEIGDPAPAAIASQILAQAARKPRAANPRHARPAPRESRQYAPAMATTAARDDRLTPNAKAFLQVLRARCGKSRQTAITKGTAGDIMARSPRTIRRYLADLVRFGYIELAIRCNARGLHLGLLVTLTERALPFFEEARGLARWLAETPKALFAPFAGTIDPTRDASRPRLPGVTVLSCRNQSPNNSLLAAVKTGEDAAWTRGKRLSKREGSRDLREA